MIKVKIYFDFTIFNGFRKTACNSKHATAILRIRPFLCPTEEYSHSTHTGHRVDASHFHQTHPRLHSSQVIPKTILPP